MRVAGSQRVMGLTKNLYQLRRVMASPGRVRRRQKGKEKGRKGSRPRRGQKSLVPLSR